MVRLVYILIFCFFSFFLTTGNAATGPVNISFDLGYSFKPTGRTSKIEFLTLIPKSIPHKQTISSINYSIAPAFVYEADGNKYAKFILQNVDKECTLTINIVAQLWRYDLDTARSTMNASPVSESNMEQYLSSELFQEKNNLAIQSIASMITGNTSVAVVKNIYSFVKQNMTYSGYTYSSLGAVHAASVKRGDCTEFSDLLVTLCRAKNIPARTVEGYTTIVANTPKHTWAEVFLPRYGWVPFDVTLDDNRRTSFNSLRPIYIYLSQNRNDRELSFNNTLKDSHFYSYWYWGSPAEVVSNFTIKWIKG